jgi:hypothetical protein
MMLINFVGIALFATINVQLVAYTVIMPAKEEHGCDSGSESLDKQVPRDILHCHVERRDQSFAVAERQNDRIKNIVSVFYSYAHMNLNYTIFVDFFLYVKHIEHQTLVSFLLLTSIYFCRIKACGMLFHSSTSASRSSCSVSGGFGR